MLARLLARVLSPSFGPMPATTLLRWRTYVRYLRRVVAAPVSPVLPRRDEHARAQLRAAATRAAPAVLAGARLLAVAGPIGQLLPAGGIQRGSTVALDGPTGAGSTTVACALAAAATRLGEWAAVVDPDGTFGGRAAAGAGVALERCAVVRHVPADRWSTVVAALLEGCELVLLRPPDRPSAQVTRRLAAHARRSRGVLVVAGNWAAAHLWLRLAHPNWVGIDAGHGRIRGRRVLVIAGGRGGGARPRAQWWWLPGPNGAAAVVEQEAADMEIAEGLSSG